MFNKKLKEQLFKARQSSIFWDEKFHENEHLLEVATEEKNFYREMMENLRERTEQLEEQTNDRFYFRMKKADYNKLVNEKAILKKEYQALKEEIEQKKQNAGIFTINLDASNIDMHELTRKIIENINKGRY